jgi:uncharacterized protein
VIFLDTSALIPRYVDDVGPDPLAGTARTDERVLLSELSRVEFRSVIARRLRSGRLSMKRAERLLAEFAADGPGYEWVPVDREVIRRAGTLVDRHALRSLDALQLGGALFAAKGAPEPLRFLCFDGRLNAAAKAEGLEVLRA